MAATSAGVSRNHYVTTRTRSEFVNDMQSSIAHALLPIEVVGHALSGDSTPAAQAPINTEELSEEEIAAERERRARKPYRWMRKKGRRYTVYNLDARDEQEYAVAARMLGAALPIRTTKQE